MSYRRDCHWKEVLLFPKYAAAHRGHPSCTSQANCKIKIIDFDYDSRVAPIPAPNFLLSYGSMDFRDYFLQRASASLNRWVLVGHNSTSYIGLTRKKSIWSEFQAHSILPSVHASGPRLRANLMSSTPHAHPQNQLHLLSQHLITPLGWILSPSISSFHRLRSVFTKSNSSQWAEFIFSVVLKHNTSFLILLH